MAHDLFATPEHEASGARCASSWSRSCGRARASSTRWAASTRRSTRRWASSACSACATTRSGAAPGSTGLVSRPMLFEELARCDNAGVSMGISVQTDMATPSLHRFGSDELQARSTWCRRSGASRSRPSPSPSRAPGSDVAGIKTRAVRDGDDWVINGCKIYITNAATADWLCLLAVTDPEGRLRRLLADHRAHRLAGLPLRAARQDRQQGLGHRPALLRRRARAGLEHHRRDRPRLPAADDAVPGRAPGRRASARRRGARNCGSTTRNWPSSACCSASRWRRCR